MGLLDGSIAGRVATAGLALVVALLGCSEGGVPARARNAILVSIDTLRADHLGTYGYERATSPRIDRFAARAFVFERVLAPAPNTPPSQMSLLTSLYPGRHGFTGNDDALAPGIETLASRLREAGWQTAGFVDGGYLSAEFGFDRGFDVYDDAGGGIASILPRVERWLARRSDAPFFLFVHCYDVHAPYLPPAPYRGMFHERPYTGDLVATSERLREIWTREIPLAREDMQHLVDSYDEGIRYTDARIGGFLQRIARSGRLADTLVVITADHGEEFGEHGSILHWQLYFQPNLRVPLIVHLPGSGPEPVRVTEQAELIDVLPTVLELLGAPPHRAAQGRSLVTAMDAASGRRPRSGAAEAPRPAFAWWPDPAQLPLRSVVLGDHQLVFSERAAGRDELYRISTDPLAQRDLAPTRPELVRKLRAIGMAAMAENSTWREARGGERGKHELDEKVRAKLRELGYLQ